jgi:hypothetical protein
MARTHFFCLGVQSETPPLENRMLYLNYKYLVNIFQQVDHPLGSCLELLHRLNPKKCLTAFHEVADLRTGHEAGYTRHSFEAMVISPVVNRHMQEVLANVDPEMYPMVDPRELLGGIIRPIYYTMVHKWVVWVALLCIIHGTVVLGSVQQVQIRTGLGLSIQKKSKRPQNSSKRPLF